MIGDTLQHRRALSQVPWWSYDFDSRSLAFDLCENDPHRWHPSPPTTFTVRSARCRPSSAPVQRENSRRQQQPQQQQPQQQLQEQRVRFHAHNRVPAETGLSNHLGHRAKVATTLARAPAPPPVPRSRPKSVNPTSVCSSSSSCTCCRTETNRTPGNFSQGRVSTARAASTSFSGLAARPRHLTGAYRYGRGQSHRGQSRRGRGCGRGRNSHCTSSSGEPAVQSRQAPERSGCTTNCIHGDSNELSHAQEFPDLQAPCRTHDPQSQEALLGNETEVVSSEPSVRVQAASASGDIPVDENHLLQYGEHVSIDEQELPSSHSFEPCIMETWMLPPAGIPSRHNGSVGAAMVGWRSFPQGARVSGLEETYL